MTTVLITGARAPVALDLARRFAEQGAEVVVADSQPTITSGSAAVARAYRIPSARYRPREFGAAVAGIARRHAVDLVLPTCEETFWLAALRDADADADADTAGGARGDGLGRLFAAPLPVLRRLHDKSAFAVLLSELGMRHPRTERLDSVFAWRELAARRSRTRPSGLVLKPAYSRFGARTILLGPHDAIPAAPFVSVERPWVAQERLAGREFCVSAVVRRGVVTAFTAYRPVVRAGTGAGVLIERLDERTAIVAEARCVLEALVGHLAFSGQLGLDLMDTPAGVAVLECNPRATSGLHLFAPADGLADAYLGDTRLRSGSYPARSASLPAVKLGAPHLVAALAAPWPAGPLGVFRHRGVPDVLRPPRDPVTVPRLARAFVAQLGTAHRTGTGLLAAATDDFEWNGERLTTTPPVATPPSVDPPLVGSPSGGASTAERFCAEASRLGGAVVLAPNTPVFLDTVHAGGHTLLVTIPHPAGAARPAGTPSYVVSPRSHYVDYARDELGELDSSALRRVAGAVLGALDVVLALGRVDDTVIVGNALLSTNLHPPLDEAALDQATVELLAAHPHSAVAWRSVHAHGSPLPAVLRRLGYRLLPARSVLFLDTLDARWRHPRDTRRDQAIAEASGYRAAPAPIDSRTGCSDPALRARIAELYGQLYVQKYSPLNPRYTAEFVEAAQRSGLLSFVVLERDGRIDGVFGYRIENGLLAAPLLGYDTTLPQQLGLYRALTHHVALTAERHGVRLHNSSGVAAFKRHRGAESALEYTAVYVAHLPPYRRAAWALLELLVRRVAVPLVQRSGL